MRFPEPPSDDGCGEIVIGYPPCSNPHHHQIVINCPVAAEEAAANNNGQQSSRQQQINNNNNNNNKAIAKAKPKEAATNNISESTPLISPRSAADAAQEDDFFRCPAWFVITYAIAFCALFVSYNSGLSIFRQPYVSIESLSFTVVDIASFDNKVTSNLEVVFLVDNNDYGNTTYHDIDIKAYHLDGVGGHFMPQPNLIATVKAEPFNFNLHGQEKTRVHGRMDGVVVVVDGYQEHVYHEKYGVSYLRLKFLGSARTPYNWLFGGTQIMAACNELKVVFPWNQTRMIEFQPPERCDGDGDFNTFIAPLVLIILFIFLVVSCCMAFCSY